MLKYNDHFTFDQNIKDLASSLAGKVRNLEDERNRIETGPNHPELKANEIATVDAKLEPLRIHALAAEKGVLFHDPRDMGGLDRDRQTWVARARERGRLVNPTNFGPSLHASEAVPLKVERGRSDSFNLGSPTMSTR